MEQAARAHPPRPENEVPVLALLAEISASLKEINSTLKYHATRFARLEDQVGIEQLSPSKVDVKVDTDSISQRPDGEEFTPNRAVLGPVRNTDLEKLGIKTQTADVKNDSVTAVRSIEVKYRSFPPPDVIDCFGSAKRLLGYQQEYISWVHEKGLLFAFDGRYSFPFDIFSLGQSLQLSTAKSRIDGIEAFSKDLSSRGGFFIFRESDMQGVNLIWNGLKIFPMLDCFPIRTPVSPYWSVFSKSSTIYSWRDPHEAMKIADSPLPEYSGWKIAAPFRRLCVFSGLLNVPSLLRALEKDLKNSINESVNYSESSRVFTFLEEPLHNLTRHLRSEQFSTKKTGLQRGYHITRICLEFQFAWYEIVTGPGCETGRRSGELYRDDTNRTLQLQSFLVTAAWNSTHVSYELGDSEHWTMIIMAPTTFYSVSSDDSYNSSSDGPEDELMESLENTLPTLAKTLFQVIARISKEWSEISEYVETFIASQSTFLQEETHDSLLFDDDTFSRSRQYFWVITTVGEFLAIIDDTIIHWNNVSNWVVRTTEQREIQQKYSSILSTIRARFESQRDRSTALRDALFNASAVVESRLSTRLSQNVKLLTYVSIFYLPLAFCAALWAIPNITDSSTRTPFIIAAILVGSVTYIIVFNLDALVSVGWRSYSGLRRECIQRMTRGNTTKRWKDLGKRFKRFEPDRGNTKPSEWYILFYWFLHPFAQFKYTEEPLTPEEGKEREGTVQQEVV